jgi:hypothetical protein
MTMRTTALLRTGLLVLLLFVFGTYTGLGQTITADSSRISYEEEESDQSDFTLKERYNYLIRSRVEEKQLWKVGLNDVTYYQGSFNYGLYLIYERKLTPSFSVMGELNPTVKSTRFYDYSTSQYPGQREYINLKYVDWDAQIGGRYYYNLVRRIRKGKGANNFSANYFSVNVKSGLGIPLTVRTAPLRYSRGSRYVENPTVSVRYGIQRRLGRYGFVDGNLGMQVLPLNTDFGSGGDFTFLGQKLIAELRIGLAIGK